MVEFILAYIFEINKNKGVIGLIKAAVKANSLSLIAYEEVRIFGWIAIAHYILFTDQLRLRNGS